MIKEGSAGGGGVGELECARGGAGGDESQGRRGNGRRRSECGGGCAQPAAVAADPERVAGEGDGVRCSEEIEPRHVDRRGAKFAGGGVDTEHGEDAGVGDEFGLDEPVGGGRGAGGREAEEGGEFGNGFESELVGAQRENAGVGENDETVAERDESGAAGVGRQTAAEAVNAFEGKCGRVSGGGAVPAEAFDAVREGGDPHFAVGVLEQRYGRIGQVDAEISIDPAPAGGGREEFQAVAFEEEQALWDVRGAAESEDVGGGDIFVADGVVVYAPDAAEAGDPQSVRRRQRVGEDADGAKRGFELRGKRGIFDVKEVARGEQESLGVVFDRVEGAAAVEGSLAVEKSGVTGAVEAHEPRRGGEPEPVVVSEEGIEAVVGEAGGGRVVCEEVALGGGEEQAVVEGGDGDAVCVERDGVGGERALQRVAESGERFEALGLGPAVGMVIETEEEGVFGGWRRQQPGDGRGGELRFGEDEDRPGVGVDVEEAATGLMNPDGFAAAEERKAGRGGKMPNIEAASGVGGGGRPTKSVAIGDPDCAATERANGPNVLEAAEAGGGELGKQGGVLPKPGPVFFDVADRADGTEPEAVGKLGGGGREGAKAVGGWDVDREPLRAVERGEDIRADEDRAVAAAGDGADVALDGAGAGFVQEGHGARGAELGGKPRGTDRECECDQEAEGQVASQAGQHEGNPCGRVWWVELGGRPHAGDRRGERVLSAGRGGWQGGGGGGDRDNYHVRIH